MKRASIVIGILVSAILIGWVAGCGTNTETTTTTTTTLVSSGAVIQGEMTNAVAASSASGVKLFAWPPGTTPANPNYPIVITTPEAYSVGIWRARLLKGLSDTSPYLMASWEVIGSSPGHFNLSSSPTQMATNADYPAAGDYTHMVPTLAYLEQELPSSIISFEGVTRFRTIMSAFGSYQAGDILVYSGGWKWVDSTDGSLSATRPASPVSVDWGEEATAEVDGHIVFEPTDVSMEGFAMPSSPSGLYTFTMFFDVGSTFAFNDVNGNGVFEPGALFPAGDIPTAGMQTTSGEASWGMGPPNLSMTATNEE